MRGTAALILSLGLYSTLGAQAAPDLSPIGCAWDKLPAAEQTRLTDGYSVDVKSGGFEISFASPDAASAAGAASQCQLNLTSAQTDQLALGLARRAAEEKAKKSIAALGEDVGAVRKAVDKMNDGKREAIGDKVACPGPFASVGEWDKSVRSAIVHAQLRFKNGRAYPFVSLAMYAAMGQEGTMRRMAGKADACS